MPLIVRSFALCCVAILALASCARTEPQAQPADRPETVITVWPTLLNEFQATPSTSPILRLYTDNRAIFRKKFQESDQYFECRVDPIVAWRLEELCTTMAIAQAKYECLSPDEEVDIRISVQVAGQTIDFALPEGLLTDVQSEDRNLFFRFWEPRLVDSHSLDLEIACILAEILGSSQRSEFAPDHFEDHCIRLPGDVSCQDRAHTIYSGPYGFRIDMFTFGLRNLHARNIEQFVLPDIQEHISLRKRLFTPELDSPNTTAAIIQRLPAPVCSSQGQLVINFF